MTTQLSTKLAALGLALMVNGLMIGAVAYLFNGQIHETAQVQALARALAHPTPASDIAASTVAASV